MTWTWGQFGTVLSTSYSWSHLNFSGRSMAQKLGWSSPEFYTFVWFFLGASRSWALFLVTLKLERAASWLSGVQTLHPILSHPLTWPRPLWNIIDSWYHLLHQRPMSHVDCTCNILGLFFLSLGFPRRISFSRVDGEKVTFPQISCVVSQKHLPVGHVEMSACKNEIGLCIGRTLVDRFLIARTVALYSYHINTIPVIPVCIIQLLIMWLAQHNYIFLWLILSSSPIYYQEDWTFIFVW